MLVGQESMLCLLCLRFVRCCLWRLSICCPRSVVLCVFVLPGSVLGGVLAKTSPISWEGCVGFVVLWVVGFKWVDFFENNIHLGCSG